MKITLDTNSLIDLNNGGIAAQEIQKLIDLHTQGEIQLRIVGISASERTSTGGYLSNFSDFQHWIEGLGLKDIEILKPFAIFDITYFDWSIWSDEEMSQLEEKVFTTLFPNINPNLLQYFEANGVPPDNQHLLRKWKNAKCDSVAYWCHIYYKGDIFVTRDKNFHRSKKGHLLSLGGKDILLPSELLEFLTNQGS